MIVVDTNRVIDQTEKIYEIYCSIYNTQFNQALEAGRSEVSAKKLASLVASKHCANLFEMSQFEVGLALNVLNMPYWFVKQIQYGVVSPLLALDMIRYAKNKSLSLRDLFDATLNTSKCKNEDKLTMASFHIVKSNL